MFLVLAVKDFANVQQKSRMSLPNALSSPQANSSPGSLWHSLSKMAVVLRFDIVCSVFKDVFA